MESIKNISWILLATTLLLAACSGSEPAPSVSSAPPSQGADDSVFRIVATTTQAFDILTILTEGVEDVEVTPVTCSTSRCCFHFVQA